MRSQSLVLSYAFLILIGLHKNLIQNFQPIKSAYSNGYFIPFTTYIASLQTIGAYVCRLYTLIIIVMSLPLRICDRSGLHELDTIPTANHLGADIQRIAQLTESIAATGYELHF